MKNHEFVPDKLAKAISGLRCSDSGVLKLCRDLCQRRLLSHAEAGYRLTIAGYDCLALKALVNAGKLTGIGSQIGVGKESDVYLARDGSGGEVCVKLHRLGRTSFRQLKNKRDYIGNRRHLKWLYISRLSAEREFTFLEALHSEGLPVPKPVGHNRHAVVMEFVCNATPLNSVTADHPDAKDLYRQCVDGLQRLAELGLVHGDYNEFNLLVQEPEEEGTDAAPAVARVRIIDLPQCISRRHPHAREQFDRDAGCLTAFFRKRFEDLRNGWLQERPPPSLPDIPRDAGGVRLDELLKASGYRAGEAVEEEEADDSSEDDEAAEEAGADAADSAEEHSGAAERSDEDSESGSESDDSEKSSSAAAECAVEKAKVSRPREVKRRSAEAAAGAAGEDEQAARRRVRAERRREMRRAGLRAGRRAAKRERTARDRRDMREELGTWG